jgi:prophage regulatory protein
MKLLRTPEVVSTTGLSRMTIYRLERAGQFPSRRQLSQNCVAWPEDEILNWLKDRPMRSKGNPGDSAALPSTFRMVPIPSSPSELRKSSSS